MTTRCLRQRILCPSGISFGFTRFFEVSQINLAVCLQLCLFLSPFSRCPGCQKRLCVVRCFVRFIKNFFGFLLQIVFCSAGLAPSLSNHLSSKLVRSPRSFFSYTFLFYCRCASESSDFFEGVRPLPTNARKDSVKL